MTANEWGQSLNEAHKRAVNKARGGGLWLGAAIGCGMTALSVVVAHMLAVTL